MKLYGIKQCDTCRKALKFLDGQGVSYEFVDLRETPVRNDQLESWFAELGADKLINRRSTSWRQLARGEQEQVMNGDLTLLAANVTLIKRPLVDWGKELSVGFSEAQWRERL
ncbi:MAG: Spx/MgsR family RNA polymerase-binding regulatory protein [Pseudomonadota bacterium]